MSKQKTNERQLPLRILVDVNAGRREHSGQKPLSQVTGDTPSKLRGGVASAADESIYSAIADRYFRSL